VLPLLDSLEEPVAFKMLGELSGMMVSEMLSVVMELFLVLNNATLVTTTDKPDTAVLQLALSHQLLPFAELPMDLVMLPNLAPDNPMLAQLMDTRVLDLLVEKFLDFAMLPSKRLAMDKIHLAMDHLPFQPCLLKKFLGPTLTSSPLTPLLLPTETLVDVLPLKTLSSLPVLLSVEN